LGSVSFSVRFLLFCCRIVLVVISSSLCRPISLFAKERRIRSAPTFSLFPLSPQNTSLSFLLSPLAFLSLTAANYHCLDQSLIVVSNMPFRMPPPSQLPSSSSSRSTPTSPVARPSTSQPLAQATLRLPAPPLPPKPLHLTISRNSTLLSDQHHQEVSREDGEGTVRQERSKGKGGGRGRRGEMPRWSNYGQDESEGDQARDQEYGTTKGISRADREEEEAEEVVQARKINEGEMERRTTTKEEEESTMSQLLQTTSIRRRREGRSDLSSNQSYKNASGTLRVGGIEEGQGTIKRKSIYFDPRKENPLLPPELDVDVNKDQDLSGEEQREKEENQDRILLNSDEPTRSISSNPDPPRPLPSDSPQLDLPPNPLLAISLHPFTGESSFGELSFEGGIELCIEVEDLGGGWSLGYLRSVGEDGRGLIPRGWYAVSFR